MSNSEVRKTHFDTESEVSGYFGVQTHFMGTGMNIIFQATDFSI